MNSETATMVKDNVELALSPPGLELEYNRVFTPESLAFVFNLVTEFQPRVCQILNQRKHRKLELEISNDLPDFHPLDLPEASGNWTISPLPKRLHNRQLDLGDIPPCDTELMKNALKSSVQGIQVDFDDGNCPSWANQIKGISNVIQLVQGNFHPDEVPPLEQCPLLLLRPRAWNMNEHNFMVHGKEIPGPLMDFGLLISSVGKALFERGAGPYFYLPKLENAVEAKLWDDIFTWSESTLGLPLDTIKACVLIENLLAAFDAEKILYELRHHSFGLNTGVWDYAASIINKLGGRKDYIIPDRNKYVNLDQPFLHNYVKLVISVCKKHEAPVTGGMISFVLGSFDPNERKQILINILKAKRKELSMGVDGFLTYDIETVALLQGSLFTDNTDPDLPPPRMSSDIISNKTVTNLDLLNMPPGAGVTYSGLLKNIRVGTIFIYSWLAEGKGHFILNGAVEDSATAEISRSQVWQWIHHEVHMEDHSQEKVTKALVSQMAWKGYAELVNCTGLQPTYNSEHLQTACDLFLELVTAFEFPGVYLTVQLGDKVTAEICAVNVMKRIIELLHGRFPRLARY